MNYFLTQQYLVSNGFLNGNIDTNIYKSLIEFSAKAYIKPLIGSVFFLDLYTKYNAQTLSVDEEALVEIIQKAIAFRVKAQVVIDASYQLVNKGVVRQTDDNATSADKSEVAWIYDHNISHAMLFQDELAVYLHDNQDTYPVFMSIANKDSKIKNNFHNHKGKDFNEGVGFIFI